MSRFIGAVHKFGSTLLGDNGHRAHIGPTWFNVSLHLASSILTFEGKTQQNMGRGQG